MTETTKTFWNTASNDIAEAIKEHPELPIYFSIPNDEIADGYSATLHSRHHVKICTLWVYGDQSFWDEDSLIDQIEDDVYYEGLFESAGDRVMEARRRFKEIPNQDCILISTSA